MRRLSAILLGLLAVASVPGYAQPVPLVPGYVILRVNLAEGVGSGGGGIPGAAGGGTGIGPGGSAPPGASGDSGSGGFGGGAGVPGAGAPAPFNPNKSVVVVVPYKTARQGFVFPKSGFSQSNPALLYVGTEFGKSFIFDDRNFIKSYWLKSGFSLEASIKAKHNIWNRDKPVQGGYDLVAEALSYGFVDLAYQYADQTVKAVEIRKDQAPPVVANFVKAYKVISAELAKGTPENSDAATWQQRLGAVAYEQSPHYALIHWGDQSVARASLLHKLSVLESNMKAFYLWHALGGYAVKVPDQRLIAVLADKATDMPRLQVALDGSPIVSDAFYSTNHSLLVLSPERMDEAGRTFSKDAQSRYQLGWNRDDLLKGNAPPLKVNETVAEAVKMMTIALVDKYIDEEATLAMISREGTRQLYAASGLLAQHVVLPLWLETGLGTLLQKPKGPVYTTESNNQITMTVGLASGYGSPNYVLIREFRKLLERRELHPESDKLLLNTITDAYFAAYTEGVDIDPKPKTDDGLAAGGSGGGSAVGPGGPGGPPPGVGGPGGSPRGGSGGPPAGIGADSGGGPPSGSGIGGGQLQGDPQAEARALKAKLLVKSQATAWALTFFLAKKKPDAMQAIYTKLNALPRDVQMTRDQMVTIFGQSVGLMSTNNPTLLDGPALKQFADDWLIFMKAHQTYGIEIPIEANSDSGNGIGLGGGFGGGSSSGGTTGGRGGAGGSGER